MKNLICKIALNKCRDLLRSKKRKKEELENDTNVLQFENFVSDSNIENDIIKKENFIYTRTILKQLKEPYKTILYEYYINEKSLLQIATKNNTTIGTIKVQLHRGKKILKEKLEKVRR